MVELEHDGISLAAIGARVGPQIVNEEAVPLPDLSPSSLGS
jgi:hypothetical protein